MQSGKKPTSLLLLSIMSFSFGMQPSMAAEKLLAYGRTTRTPLKLEAIISNSPNGKHAKIDQSWKRLYENGRMQKFQGNLDQAEKHFYDAIRQLKKVNIKDERLLQTRLELADTYLQNGKRRDAKETYNLTLKTASQIGKHQSAQVANSLAGLADIAKLDQKYKKSEKLLKQSIVLNRTVSGDNSFAVSKNLLDLAELYKDQKLYKDAEPVYQLSLAKLNEVDSVPELTKANFLEKTGMFFHEQGKMPQANKLFELSLLLKDKYTKLYSPVDARKRGLVSYRCENGFPNAARVFTRGAEVEYLKVKNAVAVATLTPQIYAQDWYLLKAEVTIQNQGKKAITACAELPTLELIQPKYRRLRPLDSDAISRELGIRGRRIYSRLLHSADLAYTVNSIGLGSASTVGWNPGLGWGMWNTVGGWVNITPNWGARIRARNAAISALGNAYSQGASVLKTKPTPITLNPGEAATFQIFYPYKKFQKGTLKFMVGNALLEFPFTSKSG